LLESSEELNIKPPKSYQNKSIGGVKAKIKM